MCRIFPYQTLGNLLLVIVGINNKMTFAQMNLSHFATKKCLIFLISRESSVTFQAV